MRRSRAFRGAALSVALVVVAGAYAKGGQPPTTTPATAGPKWPALQKELLVRFKNDQAVRQKLVALAKQHHIELDIETIS